MANIFISYNRQSEAIAKTLADDIETLGHTVWFDQELSGGQAWWDQILATIRGCDVFVFILDPEALNSTACKREYGYAVDLGKPILPVLVAEGVSTHLLPPALSQIQFVDYRKQDRNAAFRLARALTTVPLPEPLPEPLPDPPEAPISYLGSLTAKIETISTLSYEEQSVLVFDLKRSLRDPKTTDDTRTLLQKLRKRRDLFATIAEEIDELLGSMRTALEETPSTLAETKLTERQEPHRSTMPPAPTSTDRKPTRQERVKGACILAVIGVAVRALALVIGYGLWPWLFTFAIGGAIAGAISGMNWRGIVAGLVGMSVGVFFGSFILWPGSMEVMLITLLVPPLGALIGVYVQKRKVQTRRERVKVALSLAAIGVIAGEFAVLFRYGSPEYLVIETGSWLFAFVLGGAIAGAISGMNWRGIVAGLVGMSVGVFFGSFILWPGSMEVMLITLLVPPLGALIGVYVHRTGQEQPRQ